MWRLSFPVFMDQIHSQSPASPGGNKHTFRTFKSARNDAEFPWTATSHALQFASRISFRMTRAGDGRLFIQWPMYSSGVLYSLSTSFLIGGGPQNCCKECQIIVHNTSLRTGQVCKKSLEEVLPADDLIPHDSRGRYEVAHSLLSLGRPPSMDLLLVW